MPAPPHPSWWATAGPSPRDLRQAEKLPQSLEGAVQGRSRYPSNTLCQALTRPSMPCSVLPPPLPRAAVGGEETEDWGGLLDFQVQGGQRGLGISPPPYFQVSSLSWGRCSGTPPSSIVPRGISVIPCGPLGKQVWKSCGVGEPCQDGE